MEALNEIKQNSPTLAPSLEAAEIKEDQDSVADASEVNEDITNSPFVDDSKPRARNSVEELKK